MDLAFKRRFDLRFLMQHWSSFFDPVERGYFYLVKSTVAAGVRTCTYYQQFLTADMSKVVADESFLASSVQLLSVQIH